MVLDSVLAAVATVIIGVVVYAFSQVVSKFMIDPINKQDEIRGQIADSLIFYANVYANPGGGTPSHSEASQKFRELASLLMSRTRLIRKYWFFSWMGLVPRLGNVRQAHSNLIFLSNSVNLSQYPTRNVDVADEIKSLLHI